MERGEKLDDLVQKSEHLGNQSKAFYKTVSTVSCEQQENTEFVIVGWFHYDSLPKQCGGVNKMAKK